jgi:hypothetical protein
VQVYEVVAVNRPEQLIDLLGRLGSVAEGSHVGRKRLAGQHMMNRGVLVQFSVWRELSYLEHLPHLLVAHELLVHLLQLLLENEVLRVLQNLFAVESHDGLPDFLVQ